VAIVKNMILLAIMVPLVLICCIPAVCFELYSRWVPVGSLWKTHGGNPKILIVDGNPEFDRVTYRYLDSPQNQGMTSKLSFVRATTRIPKKDEPLYLLANIGV